MGVPGNYLDWLITFVITIWCVYPFLSETLEKFLKMIGKTLLVLTVILLALWVVDFSVPYMLRSPVLRAIPVVNNILSFLEDSIMFSFYKAIHAIVYDITQSNTIAAAAASQEWSLKTTLSNWMSWARTGWIPRWF